MSRQFCPVWLLNLLISMSPHLLPLVPRAQRCAGLDVFWRGSTALGCSGRHKEGKRNAGDGDVRTTGRETSVQFFRLALAIARHLMLVKEADRM